MHTESELRELADAALNAASGFDAEVRLGASDSALTRYGENVITQNVSGREVGITVRLLKDGRMGKASTGNLSTDGIKRCVDTAKSASTVSAPDKSILPLPDPQQYRPKESYDRATHELSPEARAEGVAAAVHACTGKDLQGAGIFSNNGGSIAIANSRGLWAYHRSSGATFSLSAMHPGSSGWAEESDTEAGKIDIDAISSKAVQICLDGRDPAGIDPGAYTVIFSPAAVADFLLFLGWEGFNGLAFAEGRSCFSGRTGEKVVGGNVTVVDDAWHPMTPGVPFDFEGFPRQPVTLIDRGVFHSAVHDRRTAAMAGVQSTGHALPQPDPWGPTPLNLIMSPGDSTLDDMIASTDRGVLVTRLHYTNVLDPMKMTLTGMTRDGLFLIEEGRIARGLKNMRFTDSALSVLSNVEALSKDSYKTETFWGGGGTVAPVLKVKDFHFTSQTEN